MKSDTFEKMITLIQDVTSLYAPQRQHILASKVSEIILDHPEIIKQDYEKKTYKGTTIDQKYVGEYQALKKIFFYLNTRSEIKKSLRLGLSTVLAKIAILKKDKPQNVDYYLKRGDTTFTVNEEAARLLILATKNDHYQTIIQNIITDEMCFDVNFKDTIYQGFSVATTSYIANDDLLKRACDNATYEGFFADLNENITKVSGKNTKDSKQLIELFESLKQLQTGFVINSLYEDREKTRFENTVTVAKRRVKVLQPTRED